MSINTTLQIFWGYKGAEFATQYSNEQLSETAQDNYVKSDGSTTAFEPTAYLNLGYIYKFSYQLSASIFAYNLLSIINEDLSKINEFQRIGHYRVIPASISFRLDYGF